MRRLLLAATLLAGAAGSAEAVSVSAHLDRSTVQAGDQVLLTVEAEGVARNMSDPKLPDLPDFDIRSAGTSRNFSMINGRMSYTMSRRYLLVPHREGTFTIGSIEVEIGDTVHRTEPLTLTVTKAPPPPAPPALDPDETGSTAGSENLFARATVDTPSPYVYQQVTYRVRLYTRVNILDAPNYTPPSTQGFWREDLASRDPYIETVNGNRYRVMEVVMALFPTTPGKLTIGESVIECTIEDPNRRRDPFSVFGGSLLDGKRVVMRTEPVALDVKPLPPGAPPGFAGAVGDYTLDVSVDRSEVPQNEPITLTVTLRGEGHLRTIPEIELPELPQFRSYPSRSNQETTRRGNRLGGTLEKQFVLVPLSAGELTVPVIRIPVFSPEKGRYQTLTGDPITIRAAPASGVPGRASGRGDIEVLGRDIRFIETEVPSFHPMGSSWDRARRWLLLSPVPLLAYGAVLAWEWRRRRLGDDQALRRRLRAAREARKILRGARGLDPTEQAFRAAEAVRSYLADRFDLPRAGLTVEAIDRKLEEAGLERNDLVAFLDRADAARYAPGGSPAGDGWLEEADRWIGSLERQR